MSERALKNSRKQDSQAFFLKEDEKELTPPEQYREKLQTYIIPTLQQQGCLQETVFMHDGASHREFSLTIVKADIYRCTIRAHYEQLSEFERGRIIGLKEGGWAQIGESLIIWVEAMRPLEDFSVMMVAST
ncbi:hypothetical protein TNCV_4397681 [Trichonephila clavipes]|nr:hypothetical protein TNCV_4397681 [Trichonephila clavipes]